MAEKVLASVGEIKGPPLQDNNKRSSGASNGSEPRGGDNQDGAKRGSGSTETDEDVDEIPSSDVAGEKTPALKNKLEGAGYYTEEHDGRYPTAVAGQKKVSFFAVFSRRAVILYKIWILLFLYTASVAAVIGIYAYMASLPPSKHTYGVIAVLELLDRRFDTGRDCLVAVTSRQARHGNGRVYYRGCSYNVPQSAGSIILFCLNIVTILFIICMVMFRKYPGCYRRGLVIYIWVVLVKWKIPVYYNVGAFAVVCARYADKYHTLTDWMFRDMQLAVKGQFSLPYLFWENTQIEGQCCGINGKYSSLPEWGDDNPENYPRSCCPLQNGTLVTKCFQNETWDMGCRDRQGTVLAVFGMHTILLLFFMAIVSWNLMRTLGNNSDSWGMNLLHWGLSRQPSHTASSVILKNMKISTSGRIVIEGWSDRSMKIVVLNYRKDYKFTSTRKRDFLQYVCKNGAKVVIGYIQVEMLLSAPKGQDLSRVELDSNDSGIIKLSF